MVVERLPSRGRMIPPRFAPPRAGWKPLLLISTGVLWPLDLAWVLSVASYPRPKPRLALVLGSAAYDLRISKRRENPLRIGFGTLDFAKSLR